MNLAAGVSVTTTTVTETTPAEAIPPCEDAARVEEIPPDCLLYAFNSVPKTVTPHEVTRP